MEVVAAILGVAILFNFYILRLKWNRKQYIDVLVDIGMLVILNIIFGGTILGAVSATAGSTLISLYLIRKPFKIADKPKDAMLKDIANKIDDILR